MLDRDCKAFLDQMYDVNFEELNAEILICIFWRLLNAFITTSHEDVSEVRQGTCRFSCNYSLFTYKWVALGYVLTLTGQMSRIQKLSKS